MNTTPPTALDKIIFKWVTIIGVIVISVIVIMAFKLMSLPDKEEAEYQPGGMLRVAAETCGIENPDRIGGTIRLAGEITETACVLKAINTPADIINHMESTRAIDGQQTASADGYSYRWTYHPDHGLDVTITDTYGR